MTTVKIQGIDINRLEQALRNKYNQNAELVGEKIEDEFKSLISPVLHTHTWDELEVVTRSKVTPTNRGVRIKVDATVTGNRDQKRIFNFIQWGTPNRIQANTTPPIAERTNNWTQPNKLRLFHGGFTGRFFRIGKNTLVQGIPARNFYQEAIKQLRNRIGNLKLNRWSVRRNEQ